MILRTPRSTRTYTRFPYTPLFRSAGRPADHRRHVLSASAELRTGTDVEALRAVADRVAAQAGPGEQVEAYVSQGTNTSVDAYQGQIESLPPAGSAGIGIRGIQAGPPRFPDPGPLADDIGAPPPAAAP